MGHAALRRGRQSVVGQIYLVTFTTADRAAWFGAEELPADACRIMTCPSLWQHSRLLAWVLMPDHWHGLIELGDGESLPVCMGRLKGRSARLLRQRHPALGPVWASAYQDRALRDDEALLGAARYLVMNPVRAGLVRRVGDYPFWDAIWV